MALANPVCLGCKHKEFIPLHTLSDRLSGDMFDYVQCAKCESIYLAAELTPTEMMAYYPVDYEPYRKAHPLGEDPGSLSSHRILITFVESFIKQPGHLLDVGCATGDFLFAAHQRKWNVTGIEIIPSAANYARSVRGFHVEESDITETTLPDEFFSAITMWDVLEHLPMPDLAIRRSYRLLIPGGYLFLSIPNLKSFDRSLFGNAWIGWDPPRHICLFSDTALSALMARVGFEYVDSRCILGGRGAFLLSIETT
ncbi:MAG: class I SAM-dependent methyltransferase, partial [Nitrospirales bacterium]